MDMQNAVLEPLRTALWASQTGTYCQNLKTGWLTYDENLCRLFMLEVRFDHPPGDFLDRVHVEDRSKIAADLEKAVVEGGQFVVEYRVRSENGKIRWLLDRGRMVCDGNTDRFVGACTDITRNKQLEQELKQLAETLEQRVAQRTAEAEQRAAQIRALAGELTRVEVRERRRLAQILHDHLQQLLVAARLRLGMLTHRHARPEELAQTVQGIEDLLNQAIDASRSLTVELSPPVLESGGLAAALRWLAQHMKQQQSLDVSLHIAEDAHDDSDLSTEVRTVLFNAARELLFNVVKHARVKAARVQLSRQSDGRLQLIITDRGRGFDPCRHLATQGSSAGFGLRHTEHRLTLLGGKFLIESKPGDGTRATLTGPPRS